MSRPEAHAFGTRFGPHPDAGSPQSCARAADAYPSTSDKPMTAATHASRTAPSLSFEAATLGARLIAQPSGSDPHAINGGSTHGLSPPTCPAPRLRVDSF